MISPVIERELRVALLRRRAHKEWMATIWNASVLMLILLAVSGFSANSSTGRTLFGAMFAIACYLAISRGLKLTADLFSEERRNGTLGLLVLTGLKPIEIFASKLLGVILVAAYGLLGGLPFLAVAFLIGGVQFVQFAGALAFVAATLVFCVAIGVFASVLHRDGSRAQMTALLISGALAIVPIGLGWILPLAGGLRVKNDWLAFSPLFGAYGVFNGFSTGGTGLFWTNVAITLSYSVVALFFGAVLLHRTWRETVDAIEPAKSRNHWKARLAGGKVWQRILRRELKAGNPLCWRAARNSMPVAAMRIFVLVVLAVWIGGWVSFGLGWLSGGNFLVTSMTLHQGLNWAIASAAARWFAEERQSGGFEMLLSTPTSPAQLIEGQRRGLLLQFRGVIRLVFLLDVTMCVAGLLIREWQVQALVNHLAVWAMMSLVWFGVHVRTAHRAMWIAAWTGRPAYAAAQSTLGILWAFLIPILPLWGAWLRNFPAGTLMELVVVGVVLFLVALDSFGVAGKLREKLGRELRDIACAPIPKPDDKRFKGWDPNQIFPPGHWGEFPLTPGTYVTGPRPPRWLTRVLRRR